MQIRVSINKMAEWLFYLYISTFSYIAILYAWFADAIFIGFILMAVFLALSQNSRLNSTIKNTGFGFIVALLVLTGLTYFFAQNRSTVRTTSWTLIQMLVLDIGILVVAQEKEVIRKALIAYVVGVYMMAVMLFLRYGVNTFTVINSWRLLGAEDIAININSIGSAGAWSASILLMLYGIEKKKRYLWLSIVPILFALISSSRASILIVLVCVIMYSLFSGKRDSVFKAAITLGIMIIIYYVVKQLNWFPTVIERFDELLNIKDGIENTDGSTKFRYEMVLYGLDMMKQHPIFGYGMGQFAYYSIYDGGYYSPHNTFIQVGIAFGIVGLLVWYGIPLAKVIKLRRYGGKDTSLIMVVIIIALSIMSISSQSLTDKTSHLFIMLAFAMPLCSQRTAQLNGEGKMT
jgi:O-antigen ligase